MKHKNLLFTQICIVILAVVMPSCKKYLEMKPESFQVVPSTIEDLQALLDNHRAMNELGPQMLEPLSDNYYLLTSSWKALPESNRLNYIWDVNSTDVSSWVITYQNPIKIANVVLDQLPFIETKNKQLLNEVKGAALFFRAYYYQELAQLFCPPYSKDKVSEFGLVLRLNSNVEEISKRSTLKATYDQIINDLKEATLLLPEYTLFPTRPNKASGLAALSRTYLSMGDYENAGIYADLCLKKYSEIINFNSLLPVKTPPIARFNKETIFYSHTSVSAMINPARAIIDSNLIALYNDKDLRKELFYKKNVGGTYSFRGSYDGTLSPFTPFDGLTTGEMILNRAECFARNGNLDFALKDLNTLMINRWIDDGSWVDFTANEAKQALDLILNERRKELVYRGLRWSDIRRLNIEGANIILKRVLDGKTYILEPNTLRVVLLVPPDVIKSSGIPQNPR